ncbi:acyl-CoA dehydrogenase family protein [Hyella patelloides]|uniref:acyl-CoA dehydrogenase family protein n=1 Tax=Hyella patelloides TaxID=1982969 RepID=UPI001C98158F|nr:acyl-CoA dehydrogenase family protein [Hyella patelloides]
MISLLSAQTSLSEIEILPSELDRDSNVLQQALQQLGKHSLLALKVPPSLGGAGFSESDYSLWQIAAARYSGALAFLQTQHQSAGSFFTASDNHTLQQEYLSSMATGEKLVGVGFSQLRRPGKPLVAAQPVEKGYLISGFVPWITGGNIFTDFIVGAVLPDGRELYGVVPLETVQQSNKGKITLSLPMDLIAMSATNTVSAELDNWYLESNYVVTIKPANSIHDSSQKNVLNHGWFPLGCAYAALDIIQQTSQRKQLEFIPKIQQVLKQEIDDLKQQMIAATISENTNYENKLKLRSQVINLASRCTQAAVITASGAANSLANSAGRVYREALVFSVSGQTTDVMEASLKLLT